MQKNYKARQRANKTIQSNSNESDCFVPRNLSDLHALIRINLKKVDRTVMFVCYFLSYANI